MGSVSRSFDLPVVVDSAGGAGQEKSAARSGETAFYNRSKDCRLFPVDSNEER